jgi:hypothetical protein
MFEYLGYRAPTAHCGFPGWGPLWGCLKPGATTDNRLREFFDLFEKVTVLRGDDLEGGAGHVVMQFSPPELLVDIQFQVVEGILDTLRVHTEIRDELMLETDHDSALYKEIMSSFSLANVLRQENQPDNIYLNARQAGVAWFARTILHYPNSGLLIEYETPAYEVGPASESYVSFCPNRGLISFTLYDPDGQMTVEDLLSYNDPGYKYQPLEQATELSTAEFVREFDQDDCESVIETPRTLW